MDPKYSNVFFHQGVKVFEKTVLESKQGRIKVAHLENDVTKALINLFQHCSPKVLKSFLQMLDIREAPQAFEFDFQVTGTKSYRQKPKRIMLSIISAGTQIKSSGSYSVSQSLPDASISSKDTVILIESKTQSPLIREQIQSHIKHHLGTATKERIKTWEEISDRFRNISKTLKDLDRFLVLQFCDFLELIGIAEFNGFRNSDFIMLGSLGKVTTEDFFDFKRIFLKKIEKFMTILNDQIKQNFNTKKYETHIMKGTLNSPRAFSAFYFYDESPDIHINKYPNINFIYNESGILFTLNGEIKSSLKIMLNKILKEPEKFSKISKGLNEFSFFLNYKLQFFPMNNFLWDLVPGFPKKMGTFQPDEIISAITNFEKDWANYKNTLLYEMKSKNRKHRSGRFFKEKEINYAANKNPKPNFVIRIGKNYEPSQIDTLGKKIAPFFKGEISKLNKLIDFLRP